MPTNYIDGIPVEFPHTAYPCQITFMQNVLKALKNKENALLESPTGTGKTLSLLCATLAWRTAEMGRRQLMEQTTVSKSANYDMIMERASLNANETSAFKSINSASGSSARLQVALNESLNYEKSPEDDVISDYSEFVKPPLIIYASRTHSQLSQVIGELRRTTYRPKIAIVGSRDQMCIHPNVRELSSSSAQSAVCNRLTRKKTCEFNLRVPEAINHLKRMEKENDSSKSAENGDSCCDQKIMDMEDLVRFASSHKACPYYTSRELLGEADLVFMPYNYLLDKKTRGSSLLSFKDAIVIFDEAHNVESSCYEAVSCEISSDDLILAEKELQHCLELIDSPHLFIDFSVSKDSIVAAKTFILTLKINLAKLEIPQGSNFLSLPGDSIFRVFEESQQVDPESGQVEIDRMLGSFEDIVKFYLEDQYNRRSGKKSAFQSLVSALRTIYGMAEEKDEIDGTEDASTIYAKMVDKNQKRADLISKSKSFYRMVITDASATYGKQLGGEMNNQNPKGRTMAYWCFNPGVVMKDLIGMGVRSIVLTSGTLSPMKSFMQEMQIDFKHVLENDHVIDDEQVFASVVGFGPSGRSLNSSFNQRDSKDYQQELGLSIVNFCRVIPDGVLVFFPSYQVMDSCLSYWQICKPGGNVQDAKTIFQMIQSIKIPVIEPKNKGELSAAMEKYERIIDDPKESRGAIFFAVCRGKVSEGLDFSDAKGRAVIVTGIPYPPFKDPKIILKKQYLQDQQSTSNNFLSGNEWYNQQASRAVNQALGRVIRHRKDFGAILLCDERFGNAGTIGQLSKWLRGRVSVSSAFGEVQGGLARFFKDKPRHIKIITDVKTNQDPIGVNASVSDSSSQLKKNEIQMQKFKLDHLSTFSLDSSKDFKSNLTEMFKSSQKTETKKFDWFKSSSTTAAPPATSDEKREKAQEYLELVKCTLSKEQHRKFMGLLKVYRAGQIEIESLLKDLVELLNSASAQNLLEGFETFVPLKHKSLFEKTKNEAFEPPKEEFLLTEEFDWKRRKLHSDFIGKKPSASIEPLILKRKINETETFSTVKPFDENISNNNINTTSSNTNNTNSNNLSNETCPICKDTCNDPYKAKCNHVACYECWNAWLVRTLECPLCRQRTRISQLRK